MIIADYLAEIINKAKKIKGIETISMLVRIIVIIFFLDIALREIGINIILAETSLLMLLGGVILVFVIGFGIGLIRPAEEIIRKLLKKLK